MSTAVLATLLLAAGPVELIAHRGESADAPENSLAAFKLAWERKVTAIELDVHLTNDGKLAVCHDFSAKRTAGIDLKLADSSWSQLKDLDVGRVFDPRFTGEKMPLLEEVLATIPEGCRCLVEIKVGPEAIPPLVKAVEKCGKLPEQLAVISFNPDTIAEAKRQLPQLKTYLLAGFKPIRNEEGWTPSVDQLIKKALAIKADGLDLSFSGPLDESAIRRIHEARLEVYVWTVNDAEVAAEFAAWGVNGITSDKAAWLREQLKQGPGTEE